MKNIDHNMHHGTARTIHVSYLIYLPIHQIKQIYSEELADNSILVQ